MSKTVLRKAAGVVLFLVLTAVLLVAARFLLVDDVHSYSRVMLQELYAQAGQIDTLFLGSSHCYRSVDPAAVDEALGTHSFNAGSSQQLPDGSYYMLQEAASQNDLKTVYLEMFYTGYNQSASSDVPLACYLLTDFMRWNSPYRYEYLWEMGGMASVADLLLPARHGMAIPGNWLSLWQAKLTDGYAPGNYNYVTYPDEGEAYRGNGFVYTEGTPQDGFATLLDVNPEQPLSAFGWEYLTKITDFCQEQGIRLVLFTAPLPQCLCLQYAKLSGLCNGDADFCRRKQYTVLGFFPVSEAERTGSWQRRFLRRASSEWYRSREIYSCPLRCDCTGCSGGGCFHPVLHYRGGKTLGISGQYDFYGRCSD